MSKRKIALMVLSAVGAIGATVLGGLKNKDKIKSILTDRKKK